MKEPLLLILPTGSTFMKVDEELLSDTFYCHTIQLDQNRSRLRYLAKTAAAMYHLAIHPSWRKIAIWFADYHAAPLVLAAKLLKKKSYVFIGGYDAVQYPELGMGVYCSFWRGLCAIIALRGCTAVIANHPALLSSLNTYYCQERHPDGIYKLLPGLNTPSYVIHNAIAAEAPTRFAPDREKQILTVGTTPRLQDFYNKGYDLLVEVAKRRPELRFIFVGIKKQWLPELDARHELLSLPNLIMHEGLPHPELLRMMEQSSVYAQPSISEGMPNALMEAMLMGCVPVGSNVAGIPTVIGKQGFVFDKRSSIDLESALDNALNSHFEPASISASVAERFSRDRRLRAIKDVLQPVIG